MDKFYKNESYIYLYDIDGWLVVANDIKHAEGLAVNRSGEKPKMIKQIGTNITVIEKECDSYEEATGITMDKPEAITIPTPPIGQHTDSYRDDFKKDLKNLINKHCMENVCDMPDFMLAEMITNMVYCMGPSIKKNLDWHGTDSVCHPKGQNID